MQTKTFSKLRTEREYNQYTMNTTLLLPLLGSLPSPLSLLTLRCGFLGRGCLLGLLGGLLLLLADDLQSFLQGFSIRLRVLLQVQFWRSQLLCSLLPLRRSHGGRLSRGAAQQRDGLLQGDVDSLALLSSSCNNKKKPECSACFENCSPL